MWLNVGSLDSWPLLQGFILNFVIEMSDVSDNGVVFHLSHMAGLDDVLVSGGSDEDINLINDVFNSDNFVTFHTGLEGTDRVDFSDIDSGT